MEVRTRTGNDLREVNRYFKKDGTEVANKEEYDAQPSFYRGEILTEFLPGPGWSNWSQVYVKPGEVILSPNPRRYMISRRDCSVKTRPRPLACSQSKSTSQRRW